MTSRCFGRGCNEFRFRGRSPADEETEKDVRRLQTLWQSHAVPIAITLIGAALRLRYVGSSLCMDDLLSLRDSTSVLPQSIHNFRPLFCTLLHFWRSLGPETEWWIQLLPVLFSVMAIPLAWFLGRYFGGRTVAAALSLLLATSPLHLDIAPEVRMYSLLGLLGLLQVLCYLKYRETRQTRFLIAGSLVGGLGMYTQTVYGLFLVGLFILSILDRAHLSFRRYFASLVGVAVLYAPYVVLVFQYAERAQKAAEFSTTHASSALFKLIAAYSTGFTFFEVRDLGLGAKFGLREFLVNAPLVLLAAVTFALILIGAVRQLRRPEERLARHTILSLAVLPFALAYAGVLVFRHDFTHAHYHIASLPFVLLFFVKGFQGLGTRRLLQLGAVALYAAVIGLSLYRFCFDPQHFGRRSDWRQAARFIEQHATPERPLLIFGSTPSKTIGYPYLNYYGFDTQSAWRTIIPPRVYREPVDYTVYLQQRLAGYPEVYYLWESTLKDLVDPRDSVLKSMRSIGTDESVEVFNPRLAIYGWRLQE
jgi:Ca2+/Na+ antiporter